MNKTYQKLCVLLVIQILLTGCSSISTSQSPVSSTRIFASKTNQLDVLMQYYDLLQNKTTPELVKEHNNAKQNFIRDKNSDLNRFRYILVLTLPNTGFRDLTAALILLNEQPQSAQQSTSLNSFRKLFAQLLTEQQHLLAEHQRVNDTMHSLSQKLKAEHKRSAILQKKVDDIKNMEIDLIKRDVF